MLVTCARQRALPPRAAARRRGRPTPRCSTTRAPSRCSTWCSPRQLAMREATYSAPLATHALIKQNFERNGASRARLAATAASAARTCRTRETRVAPRRGARACSVGAGRSALGGRRCCRCCSPPRWRCAREPVARRHGAPSAARRTHLPWRALLLTLAASALLVGPVVALAGHYHVLGTDRTGNDVLVQSLKSVRTAFVIGTLSTLATAAARAWRSACWPATSRVGSTRWCSTSTRC